MSKSSDKEPGYKKSDKDKYNSNSGGMHAECYPFVHFQPGDFKHNAKYEKKGSGLFCSVCGEAV